MHTLRDAEKSAVKNKTPALGQETISDSTMVPPEVKTQGLQLENYKGKAGNSYWEFRRRKWQFSCFLELKIHKIQNTLQLDTNRAVWKLFSKEIRNKRDLKPFNFFILPHLDYIF